MELHVLTFTFQKTIHMNMHSEADSVIKNNWESKVKKHKKTKHFLKSRYENTGQKEHTEARYRSLIMVLVFVSS